MNELKFITAQTGWSLINPILNRVGCEWKTKHSEPWSKATAKGGGQQIQYPERSWGQLWIPNSGTGGAPCARACTFYWQSVCILVPSLQRNHDLLMMFGNHRLSNEKRLARCSTLLMTQLWCGKNRLWTEEQAQNVQTERKSITAKQKKKTIVISKVLGTCLCCLGVVHVWILHR